MPNYDLRMSKNGRNVLLAASSGVLEGVRRDGIMRFVTEKKEFLVCALAVLCVRFQTVGVVSMWSISVRTSGHVGLVLARRRKQRRKCPGGSHGFNLVCCVKMMWTGCLERRKE